ncbi:MAG TPA: hypothetical protein VH561_14045 [Micromonosporaceae bacterium]|jgi:hypothetical protein
MTGTSTGAPSSGQGTVKVYCENCGVGYETSFRIEGRGVRTKATIFPATGSKTISRDVTRRLLALWETANEEYEKKGYEVIRESPTILGVSVGN